MPKNRVCILSGIYPPESGGPANFALTFSKFLIDKNFTVSVKTYTNNSTYKSKNGNLEIKAISRNNSIFSRYAQMVFEILKEVKIGSHIIANGCFIEIGLARFLCRFPYYAKVPGDIVWERARASGRTIKNIENFQTESLSFPYKFFRNIFSTSLKKANIVIVPSLQLKHLCEKWGVNVQRLVVIKNSVDTEKFKLEHEHQKKYDFVTVCRLVPWKGVAQIIECAKILNASLLIIGDGPERSNLEKLASGSHGSIDFFGSADRDEVLAKLKESKVFLLNSNFEATSYALLEAMACGLPGIANEDTGSEEIITHGKDGLLCGPKNGLQLLDAMKIMQFDSLLTKSMGESAIRKISGEFSTRTNFLRIFGVITEDKT